MNKTFREILAEQDDEYTYFVRSTANIHEPELCERIRLAFLPFDIKACECDSYKPISKRSKEFPEEHNSPVYSVKIVTGLPLTPNFIDALAPEVHIHVSHLRIDGPEDHELINQPEEIDSPKAQSLVGSTRLGDFIRELQTERKDRMKDTTEREVYETFYTTHRGLEDVLKKPMRKGYYMVEAYRQDQNNYLEAKGPFSERSEDNAYHDRIPVKCGEIIAEQSNSENYDVKILLDDENMKLSEIFGLGRKQEQPKPRRQQELLARFTRENAPDGMQNAQGFVVARHNNGEITVAFPNQGVRYTLPVKYFDIKNFRI